jgi:hypothetical protein
MTERLSQELDSPGSADVQEFGKKLGRNSASPHPVGDEVFKTNEWKGRR